MSLGANFAWVTKTSKNFGIVTEPLAEVNIFGKETKKWNKFVFKVDSGAVITLMNKADCSFLGYEWEKGQRVILNGFSSLNPVPTYVHKVSMKVGNHVVENVRVAFAENPIDQLLLGRLEVFHFFDIDLRGRVGQTVFYH